MKRDVDGFLQANFRRRLPHLEDPFVFPSQVQHAFFMDVEEARGWQVVCHKLARNARYEGEKFQFNLKDNKAFDGPKKGTKRIRDSKDCVPVERVERWEDEVVQAEG